MHRQLPWRANKTAGLYYRTPDSERRLPDSDDCHPDRDRGFPCRDCDDPGRQCHDPGKDSDDPGSGSGFPDRGCGFPDRECDDPDRDYGFPDSECGNPDRECGFPDRDCDNPSHRKNDPSLQINGLRAKGSQSSLRRGESSGNGAGGLWTVVSSNLIIGLPASTVPASAFVKQIGQPAIDPARRSFYAHRMAKKSGGQPTAKVGSAVLSTQSGGVKYPGPVRTPRSAKSSSLVDTRVIYCGDNLEQLKKLPDACVEFGLHYLWWKVVSLVKIPLWR